MAWTAPWTWLAGKKLTASDMNTQVRDNFLAMSTWVGYAPTFSGFTSFGNSTIAGGKIEVGSLCFFQIILTVGSSATVGSGALIFGLPGTATSPNMPAGLATISASAASTPRSLAAYVRSPANTCAISTEAGNFATGASPVALTSGYLIQISGVLQLP